MNGFYIFILVKYKNKGFYIGEIIKKMYPYII